MINSELIKLLLKGISSKNYASKSLNFAAKVSFISVFLGSLALIVALSVLDGFDNKLHKTIYDNSGHLVVKNFKSVTILGTDKIKQTLLNNYKDIASIRNVIEIQVIAKSKIKSDGLILKALSDNSMFDSVISRNKINSQIQNEAKTIVISEKAAKEYGIKIGDKINLFYILDSKSNFQDIKASSFRVVGLFNTGMDIYDSYFAFTSYNTLQSLLKYYPNQANYIELMLDKPEKSIDYAARMEAELGFPLYVLTTYDINRNILEWINVQKKPIPIVLGLISLVAIINVLTMLLMSIIEKTKTIGILKVLGLEKSLILKLFIYRGVFLTFLASILGCGIAFILSIIQIKFNIIPLNPKIYFVDSVPVTISIWNYLIVISVSLSVAFIASFIPARIASSMPIAKIFRFK